METGSQVLQPVYNQCRPSYLVQVVEILIIFVRSISVLKCSENKEFHFTVHKKHLETVTELVWSAKRQNRTLDRLYFSHFYASMFKNISFSC